MVMELACFITPLIIGVITSILSKTSRSLRDRLKLNTLTYMLIGGALILMAEHAWNGEIVPHPPFLTSMQSTVNISILLREVGVVGGSMTLAVITTWLGALVFSQRPVLKAKYLKKITTTFKLQ